MKKIITIYIPIIILFILTSCGLFNNKNLAKRYRNNSRLSLFKNASNPESFVNVGFNSSSLKNSITPEVKFNLLSLTDKGQEAYINAANLKSINSDELISLIEKNFEFDKELKPRIKIIPKSVKKSLVFTVDRLKYYVENGVTIFNYAGDRIAFLELNITIPEKSKVRFESWDRYVTDHYILNLGKVTSAQQWNASLSVSAKGAGEVSLSGGNDNQISETSTLGNSVTLINTGSNTIVNGSNTDVVTSSGTSLDNYQLLNSSTGTRTSSNSLKSSAELGASGSVAYSDRYETSLDLNSRVIKLSGSLSENIMHLQQESGQGIDLSGNVAVSVEYLLMDDWAPPIQFAKFKGLYNGVRPVSLSSVSLVFQTILFPNITEDIIANLSYSFLYRQINKGSKHLPEARHKVKYWYGKVPNCVDPNCVVPVVLIKKEEIRPKQYVIKSRNYSLQLNGVELKFENITEAAAFLRYIGDAINLSIPLNGLLINGVAIGAANYEYLTIISEQL